MLSAGIVGASGYTGLELCRLLLTHPKVKLTHVFANKNAGKHTKEIHPHLNLDLRYETFDFKNIPQVDLLFLAVPHGYTHSYYFELSQFKGKIIDLSADYRLNNADDFKHYYSITHENPRGLNDFVYGLPEVNKDKIATATKVANPGCYATAGALGLYPLSQNNLIEGDIIIDGKSGVTGAGKSLTEENLYCEANESISAYKTFQHRHQAEMEMISGCAVHFSPHLIPMNRGIMMSIYLTLNKDLSQEALTQTFQSTYKEDPFITVLSPDDTPSTKQVSGSNQCLISVKKFANQKVVIFTVIDNLLKGASGQAVQNMNLMCGFEEGLGLTSTGLYI